jgi:hypothetical protein
MVTVTIDVGDAKVLLEGGAAQGWRTVAGVVGMVARFCRARVGGAAGDGTDGSAGARAGGGHHRIVETDLPLKARPPEDKVVDFFLKKSERPNLSIRPF